MDEQPNKLPSENENIYNETATDTTPIQPQSTSPQPEAQPLAAPSPTPAENQAPLVPADEEPIAPTPLSSVISSGPQSNKKKWFILGGIGAVIILIVAAVLVYFLWYQKPEKVLGDAVGQFVTAKNMTFTGSLSTESDSNTLALSYDGAVNGKSSAIDMTAKIDASGQKFSIPLSLSGDPQQFYFKLSGLEDLEKQFVTPYLTMYGVTTAQQAQIDKLVRDIDGQWYKVTSDDLGDDSTSKAKTSCISNQIEKIRTDSATQKELSALYKSHPLFTITKSLGTKDGSIGYQIRPVSDKDAKPFFEALSKSKFFKDLQKCDSSIKIDLSDFNDTTKDTDKSTIQVWVNQWNHQLTGINFDSNDSSSPAKFVFTPKVGEVKSVETPKDAKSINDLKTEIQQLMTSLMGSDTTSLGA